jgi:hypothetical protein
VREEIRKKGRRGVKYVGWEGGYSWKAENGFFQ